MDNCYVCQKKQISYRYKDKTFCSKECLIKQIEHDNNKDMKIIMGIYSICENCGMRYLEKCNNCMMKQMTKKSLLTTTTVETKNSTDNQTTDNQTTDNQTTDNQTKEIISTVGNETVCDSVIKVFDIIKGIN